MYGPLLKICLFIFQMYKIIKSSIRKLREQNKKWKSVVSAVHQLVNVKFSDNGWLTIYVQPQEIKYYCTEDSSYCFPF